MRQARIHELAGRQARADIRAFVWSVGDDRRPCRARQPHLLAESEAATAVRRKGGALRRGCIYA